MLVEAKTAAIKAKISSYMDFPKKGVIFRDLFPVLRCPDLFEDIIELFLHHVESKSLEVDAVLGIESRGFLLAPLVALKLRVPFVPVRKPGKLAGEVKKESYTLEYGTDAVEIQTEAIPSGCKVLIVDDLIATGGTMQASTKLVESLGGSVQMCLAVMELVELGGRNKITAPLTSLMQF